MADAAPAPVPAYVAGLYQAPDGFLAACRDAVAQGHQPEAFTPYPLHGIERILGYRRSWIGRPVLLMILVTGLGMFSFENWAMNLDWPLNVGGKPYFAWQTFKIAALEIGLLFGTLTTIALALHTCRLLPSPTTRLLDPRMTDDLFCLALPVSAVDQVDQLSAWHQAHGASRVITPAADPGAVHDTLADPADVSAPSPGQAHAS